DRAKQPVLAGSAIFGAHSQAPAIAVAGVRSVALVEHRGPTGRPAREVVELASAFGVAGVLSRALRRSSPAGPPLCGGQASRRHLGIADETRVLGGCCSRSKTDARDDAARAIRHTLLRREVAERWVVALVFIWAARLVCFEADGNAIA